MTKEDKELLLKDLYARMPYGVIVNAQYKDGEGWKTEDRKILGLYKNGQVYLNCVYTTIDYIKPYLRQMSSITEDEKEELSHLLPKYWSVEIDKLNNFYFDMSPSIFMEIDVFLNIIDWLNAHHFDYRGLIEKGLALEAPEGMYEKEK